MQLKLKWSVPGYGYQWIAEFNIRIFDIEVGLFEINKNSADQFKTDIQLMVYALQRRARGLCRKISYSSRLSLINGCTLTKKTDLISL